MQLKWQPLFGGGGKKTLFHSAQLAFVCLFLEGLENGKYNFFIKVKPLVLCEMFVVADWWPVGAFMGGLGGRIDKNTKDSVDCLLLTTQSELKC